MPHMPPTTSKLSHAKKCAAKVCEEILEADPYLRFGSLADTYFKEVIEEIKAIH